MTDRAISRVRAGRDNMTDTDGWLDGFELDTPDDAPIKREQTAAYLLPRALIEFTIGMDGIKEISTRTGYCLVIQAPSEDWCHPIHDALKTMGEWDYPFIPGTNKRIEAEATQHVVNVLALGGRVVGISHILRNLPSALIAGADRTIILPQVNGKVIGAVIKRITGVAPEKIDDNIAAGLSFGEIAGCIRPKSTPEDCLRRLQQAIATKRKAGAVADDVPHVKDLHGYGEAQTWALDLIDDIEAWRRGEIAFDSIDRNAVLVSPPGMGKTTFARSLAKSCGLPLVSTSVGEWFANSPGYLDSVIKQIDQVFSQARGMAPAVLFLDEIDAVPNRATISPRGADWWLPVITHLLITLDSAVSPASTNLIVIGATNHGDRIDAALVRPGRLSRIITIEQPDPQAIAGIFRQHLGSDLDGEDLVGIATLASGSSGAMIVAWVNAARRKARQAKRAMIMSDLVNAIAPPSDRPHTYLRCAAIHEAGHAVAAHILKVGQIEAVSIVARGDTAGFTRLDKVEDFVFRRDVERFTIKTLAGRAAEDVVLGEPSVGAGGSVDSDLARATMNIATLHLSTGLGDELIFSADYESIPTMLSRSPRHAKAVEDHLRRLYDEAKELVRTHVDLVNAVADALLTHRVLNREAFLGVVKATEATIAAASKENRHG